MTPEEAKQLKTGDRVLIEAEVNVPGTSAVDEHGEVHLYVPNIMRKYFYCRPSSIREKLEPPRRKFEQGDIIRFANDARTYEVCGDEVRGIVKVRNYCRGIVNCKAEELLLVCAVEDRVDIKEEA